jgi:hypothetical protein
MRRFCRNNATIFLEQEIFLWQPFPHPVSQMISRAGFELSSIFIDYTIPSNAASAAKLTGSRAAFSISSFWKDYCLRG